MQQRLAEQERAALKGTVTFKTVLPLLISNADETCWPWEEPGRHTLATTRHTTHNPYTYTYTHT